MNPEVGVLQAILPRRQLLIQICVGLSFLATAGSTSQPAEEAPSLQHHSDEQSLSMLDEMGNLNETTPTSAEITAGQLVKSVQAPWMVSISLRGTGHVCGGVIIDRLWILTAATCIKELKRKQNQVVVLAGLDNPSQKQLVTRAVAKMIKRRGCMGRSCIGLMKLSEPFEFKGNVKQIKLLAPGNELTSQRAKTFGWALWVDVVIPSDLQQLDLTIKDRGFCHNSSRKCHRKHTLCAVNKKGVQLQFGYAGAPLVVERARNSWLVGIYNCASEGGVSYYTDIAPFYNWIADKINLVSG